MKKTRQIPILFIIAFVFSSCVSAPQGGLGSSREQEIRVNSVDVTYSGVAERFVDSLAAALDPNITTRVLVLDFVDPTGTVTSITRQISDEVRVATAKHKDQLSLVEREMINAATTETQFANYFQSHDQSKIGSLALFAPADIVVAGRVDEANSVQRLFLRAFKTSDGVVVFADTYELAASEQISPKASRKLPENKSRQIENGLDQESVPQDQFTIGSPAERVIAVMGQPDSVDAYDALQEEVWHYGYSTVTFDLPARTVREWHQFNVLLHAIISSYADDGTDSSTFTVGSSDKHVATVQGSPDAIEVYRALNEEVWHYGTGSVTFRLYDRAVVSWNDPDRKLHKVLTPVVRSFNEDTFTTGSPSDLVLVLHGTPDGIEVYSALGQTIWHYGRSTVTFSLPGMTVKQWDSNDVRLKARVHG